jgi:hypothetical protein
MPAATWAMAALSFVLAFLAVLYEVPRDADVRGYFHGRRHSLCAHLCTPPKLGKSHWWLGIWLIPFVGFYVTVLCLAAPQAMPITAKWTLRAERSSPPWLPSSPS